jgi:hypothetical protein
MSFLSIIREKCLLVKEKWAFAVDMRRGLWYRSWLCGWSNACPFVVYLVQHSSALVCLAVVLGHD